MNRETVAAHAEPVISIRDDCTVVTLQGELDMSTCPLLRDRLAEVLEQRVGPLVVDLGGVTFCDAAGLAMLVGTQARARRAGSELYITGECAQVAKVLRATELERVLHPPPEGLGI